VANDKELRIVINSDFKSKGFSDASSATDKLSQSMSTLAIKALSAVAGVITVKEGIQEFIATTDSFKLLEARIKIVSSEYDNYLDIQKQLTFIANENRVAINSVGQLYAKITPDLNKLGLSTQTVMLITDAFSKSLLIGGASTEEAASATLQFAQAMASGKLQGDEYRSMIENNPRMMRLLRDELGKTSAEIKQMATDGNLTASVISNALIGGLSKLKEEATSIPKTIGGSYQVFKNELGLSTEAIDKASGASNILIGGIELLTETVKKTPQAFKDSQDYLSKLRGEIEKINDVKVKKDSFFDLLFNKEAKFSVNDSLLDTAAKSLNSIGQIASETWGIIDKSAGEWATIIDSSYKPFTNWANYTAEALGNVVDQNIELRKEASVEIQTSGLVSYQETIKKTAEEQIKLKESTKKMLDMMEVEVDLYVMKGIEKDNQDKADAIKKSTAAIEAQLSALSQKYSIIKQTNDLSIESELRNSQISTPKSEYLKEENDITIQIAKNQETINLLRSKKYEGTEATKDEAKDIQKVIELQKDNELYKKQNIANQEKYNATIKATNEDLKNQTYALDLTDIDKQYLELVKTMQDLTKAGADFNLKQEYGARLAERINATNHLESIQKNLDLQEQQVALLDDETDKKIALINIDSQRRIAQLETYKQLEPANAAYYQQSIENEEKLRQKTLEHYTTYGQVIDGVSSDMQSSFGSFLDYSSDGFRKWGKLASSIINDIYNEIMRVAVIKPLISGITSSAMSYFSTPSATPTYTDGWASGIVKNAVGGIYDSPSLSQYSNKIVSQPTLFAFATGGAPGMGLMGEAGSEAILPLTRTSNGNLGVQAVGGGGVQNMKIEIINQSGESLKVSDTKQSFDGAEYILTVVLDGVQKNKMGMYDMIAGIK